MRVSLGSLATDKLVMNGFWSPFLYFSFFGVTLLFSLADGEAIAPLLAHPPHRSLSKATQPELISPFIFS